MAIIKPSFKKDVDHESIKFYFDEIERSMEPNDFQRNFFESLLDQYEKKNYLSDLQYESLVKTYERVTS